MVTLLALCAHNPMTPTTLTNQNAKQTQARFFPRRALASNFVGLLTTTEAQRALLNLCSFGRCCQLSSFCK
jgi:hypothetical protein